jgi:hypothetical protein
MVGDPGKGTTTNAGTSISEEVRGEEAASTD